ncbi:MAG: hypothetical protein ABEI31_09025 [Halodesulfurarchaeum sp.]
MDRWEWHELDDAVTTEVPRETADASEQADPGAGVETDAPLVSRGFLQEVAGLAERPSDPFVRLYARALLGILVDVYGGPFEFEPEPGSIDPVSPDRDRLRADLADLVASTDDPRIELYGWAAVGVLKRGQRATMS